MASNFDVVISGISGRFPECNDIDTFKKKLYTDSSSVFVTTDERKWKNGFKLHRYGDKEPIPRATGKFIDPENLDYRVFKFNRDMARSTTVTNRKCFEVSFEAIVDAGINPSSLSGANIGVFTAFGIGEHDMINYSNVVGDVFILGGARSMGSSRLSYALNLTGPSHAIFCDPFGSVDHLKFAKTMIQNGSIEGAIVVISHHIQDPQYSYLYKYLNYLTSEEFCRSFDKNANGFVRSESAVALFLQREQDAKRIYAKINFCDTLYEGLLPQTLLGFDEEYLRNSLLKIYERNGGDAIAKDLAFLELSGSAVKRIDTIETNAVADVLFKWRQNCLPVGSIKSVVGHTEACSPFLSLLKIIFALDSKMIARNRNFWQPNEKIRAFCENKFQVINEATKLSGHLAAINTIGLFGAVNHVVLQQNFKESENCELNKDSLPRLLVLSGRTVEGLQSVFMKIESQAKNVNVIAMTNDVFSTHIPCHILRGFTILTNTELVAPVIEECGDQKRPICFVFTGMGSQWNGMGKQLINLPIFADTLKRCDAVLKPKSIDIYDIILSDDPTMFDNITMSFVAIICVQIALVEVLKQLGIEPDIILGHSVGENGCAYADGCVTLEQAILTSLARGTVSTTTKLIRGMMAAVGKGYKEMKDSLPESIEVACRNSATSCTISGPAEDVNNYVETLKKQNIFARTVNVSNIAYHSRYIQALGPKLRNLLEPLIPNPKKRSSKWISSSIPEEHWSSPLAQTCSAEYFTNNILNPVLFEEACKHIPNNAVVIEIAPHGLLQAILKRALPDTCTNISLTRRSANQDNLNTLLAAIGRLYIAGCDPAVNNLYPPVEYPVPRGTPSIAPYCTWYYGDCDTIESFKNPYFPVPLSREKIIVRINENAEFAFLKYHQINGETVIPTSFFLYLAWHMLSVHRNVKMDDFPVLFENILNHRNIKISIAKPRIIYILIQATGSFEVLSRPMFNKKDMKVVLTGRIEFIQDENESPKNNFTLDSNKFEYNKDVINKMLRDAGFQLSKCFLSLIDLNFGDSESTANIQWDGNWVTLLDAALKFQMFSDIHKSKLCYLHSARRIWISPSIIGSKLHGSKIGCYYNKVTREFQSYGIEMNDVKWKIKHPQCTNKSPLPLKLRKLKFVSYHNPSYHITTVNEFLELCLQIATEDFQATDEADCNLIVCDETKKFIKNVKNSDCIRNLTKFKVSYKDIVAVSSKNLSGNEKFILITEDNQYLANENCASDLFVLLILPEPISSMKIPSKFISVISQSFSGRKFSLLKKNRNACQRRENNANQYHIENGHKGTRSEVIIRSKLDSSDLSLMLSGKKCSNARYLFVSTKESTDDHQSRVASVANYNLPVSVLIDEDWGSYRYLPTPKTSSVTEKPVNNWRCNNIQIESINVECVRCENSAAHLDEIPSNSEIKLVGVEYSGWNSAKEKIMGLTSASSSHPISNMDPLLTWQIPDGWKFTEAVTVLAAYTHAYSVFKFIESSSYMPAISIVIIADKRNLFARSLISLCIAKHLTLYCVVPDEKDAEHFKLLFPMLGESSVIVDTKNNFDTIILMKTEGKGANIIVNFSPGFQNTISSVNCASIFSQVIETVEENINESRELGLYQFLKSCSFYVIPCKILYFLKLPDHEKIYLQNAVRQGIQDGFVKPFFQKPDTDIAEEYRDRSVDETSIKWDIKSPVSPITNLEYSPENLKFVANRSHIIIVGGQRDDTWMKIIQWLKERDASHFVVVEKFHSNHGISEKIDNLLRDKKITISFKTFNELNSSEDAAQLIHETNKLAPIDSIFFVSMESSSKMINYMDNAIQASQNVKFISLFAAGVEEMKARQRRGQPSFVLHGESFPENLPEVLTDFEKMLETFEPTDNQRCLYKILENSNSSGGAQQLTDLRLVLPKNIYDLERIGRNISDEVKFVEMTSRCVRLANCQGVYPIFVIPGLHAFQLQPFLQSLMYPVFCASLTENSSSVHEIASKLHEQLSRIQKVGPVTLIGETWNAAIAIELSSLIKKSGRDFKVFVLEGNPKDWKNTINTLNLIESQQFEKVLNKIYRKQIQEHHQPWNLLEAGNNAFDAVPNEDRKINSSHVHRCLNVLRQQFMNFHDYNFRDSLIENTVFFSKQASHNFSLVLSDSSDLICIEENDYDDFIRSPVIRKIVNKHALFAW